MAASKRKREVDDLGKRKRAKQDKSKSKHTAVNGQRQESFSEPETTRISSPMEFDADELKPGSKSKGLRGKERKKRNANRHSINSQELSWKVSEPMGGRMLDIDPVLTDDEQHLILAYNTSVQVFSSADSLLVRKIALPMKTDTEAPEVVVAMRLSATSQDILWVASSMGRIWKLDWTNGAGSQNSLKLECKELSDLVVEKIQISDKPRDVLFTSLLADGRWCILACDIQEMDLKAAKILATSPGANKIQYLRSIRNGYALAASAGNDVLLGAIRSKKHASSLDDLVYGIYVLDCSDEITCLDIRGTERVHLSKRSQRETGNLMLIDVVVGCARGAVYVYNDLLPQLNLLEQNKGQYSLQPRKYHWHRKAVHAVKWSEDGNYIISGGSETVLVLWQLDTGRLDMLPHLTATIENIVISTRGSSYVVHLDDNSTMILSTAEMKPTTYISGIQALVSPPPISKDDLVLRVNQLKGRGTISKIPAAINPKDLTRLQLCVGNGQAGHSLPLGSMPLLQTIDLSTIQGIAKQALTRSHATDVNTTSGGHAITEPRVSHLAYSYDGRWLATIDEWEPPFRDVEALDSPPSEKREVFLKFWSSAADGQSFELTSRINAPHYDGHNESVLDLAADPSSHRFATIGEDGIVRLWQPALRQRNGLVVQTRSGRQMETWICTRMVHLQENKLADSDPTLVRSGAVSFSEDGSMLACAFQNGSESAVYIVDAETGQIIETLYDLIRGQVQGIRVLSSQLVVLSEDLVVYDIVMDEMNYGICLSQDAASSRQQLPLSQLAVDYPSRSFAVAVPRANKSGSLYSELAVFKFDQCEPEIMEKFPHPIVALVTSPGSSSFVILDSAAQLWSISRTGDMKSMTLAQPLADIHLDKEEAEPEDVKPVSAVISEQEDDLCDDEMEIDAPEDEADDDDVHQVVVPQQKLAELFDAAPPFAMPPIEEMFYQVAKLFSSKASTIETA